MKALQRTIKRIESQAKLRLIVSTIMTCRQRIGCDPNTKNNNKVVTRSLLSPYPTNSNIIAKRQTLESRVDWSYVFTVDDHNRVTRIYLDF
ncbi:hypothetical protein TcasGA2_TC002997 [Tribolium castaneum]|uniref:Uncharacterized protein n=1 Tax=Tribolium castaneum TaxID=7070 RepID=D6WGI0_TRICA|nr:hypothetical protein TcasGA2_TC002997 [Tribolium castaneum]